MFPTQRLLLLNCWDTRGCMNSYESILIKIASTFPESILRKKLFLCPNKYLFGIAKTRFQSSAQDQTDTVDWFVVEISAFFSTLSIILRSIRKDISEEVLPILWSKIQFINHKS